MYQGRYNDTRCGLKAVLIIKEGWDPTYIPVPLKSVDVSARLINYVAEVTITQTYQNVEENPIECEYMFPIEEAAAVIDFKAELEGRTLVSQVKANEEAEKNYKDAVSKGKTGFLVQTVRPDILQMKVGHLSPGASCTISLTYIMEAALDAGKVRLTIPTTISPKYVPFHDGSPEAEKIKSIKYDFSSPAPMKFCAEALMKTHIEEVTSPSHKITTTGLGEHQDTKDGLYKANIELKSTTTDLDRDIIVLVKCESANQSVVLREQNAESTVLMVSLVPNLLLKSDPELDIVFLIDCSGSMQGSSIKLARDAINILLHSLPSSAHFNIIRFGSRYESLFPASVPYTDDSLGIAREAMKKMEADLGGTEILSPLKMLLEEKTKLPRRVFVLTDGSVSNSMECLKLTRKHNKDKKVFALGIGSAADRHLVKGLARAGHGTSEFTVEEEMIAPKVIKQLKHCLQPNLKNVNIDWGAPLDINNSCQAPSQIPSLYNGSRIQVFRLIDKMADVPSKIKITAEIPTENESYEEDVTVDVSCLNGDLLHKMFARKMIQEFEEREEIEDEKDIKELVTELSLKYQLMSKHTSIVAIDTKENKSSLAMQSRSIPNQVPRGFHGRGFNGLGLGVGGAMRSSGPMVLFADCSMAAPPKMKKMMFGCSRKTSGAPDQERSRSRSSSSSSSNIECFRDQERSSSSSSSNIECLDSSEMQADDIEEDATSSIDKVINLISLQTTEGSFSKNGKIIKLLELTESEVDEVAADTDDKVVYTLLVLTALKLRFKEFESSWELVGSKAEQYLKKHNPPAELNDKIINLLNKN